MIESILYILLALLGISFLVFIHELGHYFMAKKVGITVEAFSIGFGKSILEWKRNGVLWKIGILPFGGYVKMAGMEKTGSLELSQIQGGFFASKPWDRIKVAAMGPIINILFAFLVFTFLWSMGGRDKPFAEFTKYIGWVEQDSNLYQERIRPGDEITKLNNRPFKGFNDLLHGAVFDDQALTISGQEINYIAGAKTPFTYTFNGKRSADGMERISSITRSLSPAEFLIYDKMPNGAPNKLLPGSPLEGSGIAYGDQILWVDGSLVFSQKQLSQLVNAPKVLLSIERDGKIFTTRVPRLQLRDIQLSAAEKDEIDDWGDAANLKKRVNDILFIPYNLDRSGTVESAFGYIDEEAKAQELYEEGERIPSEEPLLPGDRVLAVQGVKVQNAVEMLKELQEKKVLVIVKKLEKTKPISWKDADSDFVPSFDVKDIEAIVNSLGTDKAISELGNLSLLHPIIPIPMETFPLNEEQKAIREEKLTKMEKVIEEIKEPRQKALALANFEQYKKRLMLGVALQDKTVAYNPPPFTLLINVFQETYRTFFALITGYLSPKYMSGPVGIIQVIQKSWSVGVKEAIYWLGMISINLGILNLLPIPVLDGGHICFALWEKVTKKPIKAKTMEKLIFPFVILLIAFFVYLTYHDIIRIIKQLF